MRNKLRILAVATLAEHLSAANRCCLFHRAAGFMVFLFKRRRSDYAVTEKKKNTPVQYNRALFCTEKNLRHDGYTDMKTRAHARSHRIQK